MRKRDEMQQHVLFLFNVADVKLHISSYLLRGVLYYCHFEYMIKVFVKVMNYKVYNFMFLLFVMVPLLCGLIWSLFFLYYLNGLFNY